MKWAVIVLAALLAVGCRISINKWGGVPPRASDRIKIAVHDNGGGKLAERVLKADSRVEVIAFDPATNLNERDVCGGSLGCPGGLKAACVWAYHQGADYYAIATQYSNFDQKSKCVKSHTDWSKVFSKSSEDSEICDESVITEQGTVSTFAIKVYDTYDCEEVTQLSKQVSTYASGEKYESGIESQMSVAELAPTKYPGFPDQTIIGPSGQVVNAPGDGEYALFRARDFQGIARLHHTGTPHEHIHMLMCCEEPEPGDILVKRGPMKFIEFDLSFDTAILSSANSHQGAYGAGIHLRHRRLASGLEIGVSGDAISSGDLGAGLLSLSAGYGYQITPLLHLSASAEAGFAQLLQSVDNPDGELARAWTPYVMPQLRAQAAVRWWYVGLDLGYAVSSTVGRGDWDGPNAGMAVDARLRGPLARLYAGLTL
jgi:hypothetical protein